MDPIQFSEKELIRYERQINLFGRQGQEKLRKAKVLIAGAGGLGSAVSLYLAAAGIGCLRIVDRDPVELSNLNRQILYGEKDISRLKAAAVKESLIRLNPKVTVDGISEEISHRSVDEFISGMNLIVDALDNWQTRYILNDSVVANRIPLVHAAVREFSGQITTIIPGRTPCLRCLFPTAPFSESPQIVGSVAGAIGCLQATEALKYLLGRGRLLTSRILIYDGLQASMEEIPVRASADCGCIKREI